MNDATEITVVVEKTEGKYITIDFPEQDMTVEEWREAYFNLLVWKNTWCFPYELDIKARHDHSAFIVIVVDADRCDGTLEFLKNYGFKNINVEDITIGTIDGYEAGVDELYVE